MSEVAARPHAQQAAKSFLLDVPVLELLCFAVLPDNSQSPAPAAGSSCSFQMQVPGWVSLYVPQNDSTCMRCPLLRWAQRLAPVASMALTSVRVAALASLRGEATAHARAGAVLLTNLQLTGLSRDPSTMPRLTMRRLAPWAHRLFR